MKSNFSPNINKIYLRKNLNLSLESSSPLNLKKENKNKLFYLPPIDNESKKKALNRPTSILTKFIHDRTRNLINNTKKELKRPIKLKLDKIQNLKKTNNIEEKSSNFFITNNEIDKNPEPNSKNDNHYYSFSNQNQYMNLRNQNNLDNLSSLTIDHKIRENQMNNLLFKFRRTRIYQPIISENWKFKNGLRITVGNDKTNSLSLKNDVEYQYKIINDEYKLLDDNYTYYKTRIIIKDFYYDSFRSLSLTSKINYNKSLEESIGILYLLPQLLLVEFYKLIKNYSSVSIPNPDLFKEKYVFDEVKNLKYNNNLLIKVYDFFKSCYEVYGTLIKEVNDMCLKTNGFLNVINCLEKARYNLSYVATSSENAFRNYMNDLKYIQKIINDKTTSKSIDLSQKMRNQFGFKKNEEKQRRLRIETALDNKEDREEYYDDNVKRSKIKNKKRINSFVQSKLINGLMKHLTKDAKNQITTEKINMEIDGNYDEDEEDTLKKHKVVKINI